MSKTVLCVGCFDLFHRGHLRHLEAAYDMGDKLVVAVTRDVAVKKGNGRPIYRQSDRAALIQGIWCVEKVILVYSSLEALQEVSPDIFALGSEYRRKMLKEDREYCAKHGIQVRFTNEPAMSSTEIYDRIRKR